MKKSETNFQTPVKSETKLQKKAVKIPKKKAFKKKRNSEKNRSFFLQCTSFTLTVILVSLK